MARSLSSKKKVAVLGAGKIGSILLQSFLRDGLLLPGQTWATVAHVERARVLKEKEFDSVRPETIVALVQESGALDRARNLAHEYAHRAKACLNGHGDSEYARALRTLPDFILEREN